VTFAGGGSVRVDQVLGAFEAPVARPPWPLDAVPHVVGTTVAPKGHILLVLDPTSAQRPRGSS
jgi:chemotaxis protein histidine kinase CheA